jgi:hypothetical protein
LKFKNTNFKNNELLQDSGITKQFEGKSENQMKDW